MKLLISLRRKLGRLRLRNRRLRELNSTNKIEAARFLTYSSTIQNQSIAALQGLIIRQAHGIEVGLTYKPTRPGFGKAGIEALITNLEKYVQLNGSDSLVEHVMGTLAEYCRVNRELGHFPDFVEENGCRLAALAGVEWERLPELPPRQYQHRTYPEFDQFARDRRSCREYVQRPVDMEIINSAVTSALRSPSACNRQPCRVYVLNDPVARERALSLQNNRSSWRSDAGRILVITVDQGFYHGTREYNAAYVDGGLFCMTLAYSLHSQGLGTCMLNLNLPSPELDELRSAIGASGREVFIMMMATGYAQKTIPVCRKYHRSTDEVVVAVDAPPDIHRRAA